MSGPLAIAAVTAALKDLLNNGLLDHDLSSLGSFSVTALPPDRITTGQTEPNQLNLFLYQVTPNPGWRNEGLPSRDRDGARLTNPPLALDLHYLLTAYGSQDFNAEILLGYAMQLLHETPVLSRQQLRTVLGGTPPVGGGMVPAIFGNLSAIDLADQVELIKISPVTLSTEDLSKMWTAMQARYRMTMAYLVTVVLIQATTPVRSALPVLKRGRDDRGPVALAAPLPTLTAVRPASSDLLPAMRLGDDLLVTGANFDSTGTLVAVFENMRADITRTLPPVGPRSPTTLTLHLPSLGDDPNAGDQWAIGMYAVTLRLSRPELPPWSSNGVPIALAPSVTVSAAHASPGNALTLTCVPRLRPEQEVSAMVFVGSQPVRPSAITTPSDVTKPTAVGFTFPAVSPGDYVIRLRVEGIDSLPVTVAGTPPKLDFDPAQKVTVP